MDLINFIGNVGNTPNMGLSVSGDLRMLLGEYNVGVKLRGDLLNVELPITGSIHYQDVPLQIRYYSYENEIISYKLKNMQGNFGIFLVLALKLMFNYMDYNYYSC